jgi:glycerophosphoryl diester phosphodiesterase
MKRPLLLGHRGSPKVQKENTLESFRSALEAGLDGFELDVQRTLDGVLVTHHDFHLSDGRLIAALRHAELPAEIPTLEAVLKLAHDRNAFVNVEIKLESANTDGRERETAALIARLGMPESTMVSSFNPLSLARVKFADFKLQTALLYAPGLTQWYLKDGVSANLLFVSAIHPNHSQVTPELIARAHARGWRVNTWTVNDLETARQLIAMGTDGLIGDYPALLIEARDSVNAVSSAV